MLLDEYLEAQKRLFDSLKYEEGYFDSLFRFITMVDRREYPWTVIRDGQLYYLIYVKDNTIYYEKRITKSDKCKIGFSDEIMCFDMIWDTTGAEHHDLHMFDISKRDDQILHLFREQRRGYVSDQFKFIYGG